MIFTTEQYNNLYQRIESGLDWYVDFMNLCRDYYLSEPVGGNLHIVLDDENIGKTHIAFCSGLACAREDKEASQIANLMQAMTKRQRKLVVNDYSIYAGGNSNEIADITCGEVYK